MPCATTTTTTLDFHPSPTPPSTPSLTCRNLGHPLTVLVLGTTEWPHSLCTSLLVVLGWEGKGGEGKGREGKWIDCMDVVTPPLVCVTALLNVCEHSCVLCVLLTNSSGKPKVTQLDYPQLRYENILWFHISVDDLGRGDGREGMGDGMG